MSNADGSTPAGAPESGATSNEPLSWRDVRDAERMQLGLPAGRQPLGLALSGGGIRAATFSLGLLQGLAEERLLSKFHYLSTVSGGGYIGSWLSALIRRRAGGKVEDVEPILAPPPGAQREDSAVQFLRRYSNYLTPQVGIMSVDTWTALVTYSRNLLINLPVLLCVAVTLILAVHLCIAVGAEYLRSAPYRLQAYPEQPAFWLGLVALIIAAALIGLRIGHQRAANEPASQKAVLLGVVLPSVVAAASWAFHYGELAATGVPVDLLPMMLRVAAANGAVWLMVGAANAFTDWKASRARPAGARPDSATGDNGLDQEGGKFNLLRLVVGSLFGGAAAGALLWGYVKLMDVNGALGAFIASGNVDVWLASLQDVADVAAPDIARAYLTSAFHLAVGTLVMLWIFATAVMVVIALAKRRMSESDREWLARLGGWLYVGSGLWCIVFSIVAVGPGLVIWLAANFPILAKSSVVLWVLQTLGALILGKSSLTGGREPKRAWLEKLLSFAPYIFILGVLFIVAFGVDRALIHVNHSEFTTTVDTYCSDVKAEKAKPSGAIQTELAAQIDAAGAATAMAITQPVVKSQGRHCDALNRTIALPLAGVAPSEDPVGWFFVVLIIAAAITGLLSWRVDINVFSFQQFYRNRLARCYLGASRFRALWESAINKSSRPSAGGRTANQFTDLAAEDDLYMAPLRNQRPFHIINTALNLTAPGELGWQERKAASFTLTPLHCGFSLPGAQHLPSGGNNYGAGYRPTEFFSRGDFTPDDKDPLQAGATVGLAMSTSGAAASSSMGHNSTGALALLLTVFNVRLGRWVGNPAHRGTPWKERAPWWGLKYLMYELFGTITNRDKFVYLSDGGHFENLGVYELVRRRCALIVVSSCGKDSEYAFDDLANAIRLCNIDFGVVMEVEPRAIKPDEHGTSKAQYVIGRIRYSALGEGLNDGTLVYIKPAITARTSVDIRQYRSVNPDFPQQSTANQWYTESQFESYRKLGLETARSAFARGTSVRAMFDGLTAELHAR
jgi:hypothetical protein